MRAIAIAISRLFSRACSTNAVSSGEPNLAAKSLPAAIGAADFGSASRKRGGGGTVLSGFSHSRLQPPRLVAMKTMAVKAALNQLKGVSGKIEFPSARRAMRWSGRLRFNSFAERKRRNDERR